MDSCNLELVSLVVTVVDCVLSSLVSVCDAVSLLCLARYHHVLSSAKSSEHLPYKRCSVACMLYAEDSHRATAICCQCFWGGYKTIRPNYLTEGASCTCCTQQHRSDNHPVDNSIGVHLHSAANCLCAGRLVGLRVAHSRAPTSWHCCPATLTVPRHFIPSGTAELLDGKSLLQSLQVLPAPHPQHDTQRITGL